MSSLPQNIRIIGVIGIAVGLMTIVFSTTSTVNNINKLTGSIMDRKAKEVTEVTSETEEAQVTSETEEAQVISEPEHADLTIAKTGPENLRSGENLIYDIMIGNLGPKTVSQIQFKEPMNHGVAFLEASVRDRNDSVACNIEDDTWVCTLTTEEPIATGEMRTITMTYEVTAAGCDETVETGPTRIESPDDTMLENNEASVVTTRISCEAPEPAPEEM